MAGIHTRMRGGIRSRRFFACRLIPACGLFLAALGLLDGCIAFNSADHPDPPFSEDKGVVVLFSGLTLVAGEDVIWSTGMHAMTQEIRAAGVPAELYTPQEWEKAAQYIESLPNARQAPVAIVGYSLGAEGGTKLANALKDAGIPVQTLVMLEPFNAMPVSCNVSYAVDVYSDVLTLMTGQLKPGSDFMGTMEYVVFHLPDPVFHFTIAVDSDIRALVQKKILDGAVVRRRPSLSSESSCKPNAITTAASNK